MDYWSLGKTARQLLEACGSINDALVMAKIYHALHARQGRDNKALLYLVAHHQLLQMKLDPQK